MVFGAVMEMHGKYRLKGFDSRTVRPVGIAIPTTLSGHQQ